MSSSIKDYMLKPKERKILEILKNTLNNSNNDTVNFDRKLSNLYTIRFYITFMETTILYYIHRYLISSAIATF